MSSFNVRECLFAGIAVLMVLFLSTSVLLYLQTDTLEEKLATANGTITAQEDHINTLHGINESNKRVLDEALGRIDTVAESMAVMMQDREEGNKRFSSIKRQLDRLEKNDEIMQKYLDSSVPSSVIELLKPKGKGSDGIQGGGDKKDTRTSNPTDKATGAGNNSNARLSAIYQVPAMSSVQDLSGHFESVSSAEWLSEAPDIRRQNL